MNPNALIIPNEERRSNKENIAATTDQQRFYEMLFGNAKKYVEIRLIDSKKKAKPKQLFLTLPELLHYSTPQDTNVFVGIFQRGIKGSGTIKSCTTTNVIYLDFDDMELIEIAYRIDNSGLPSPSMIVSSGNGYHVYWALDKPAGHEVKPVVKAMQELLHADPDATDIARILRVPDTMNTKAAPLPCRLIERNDKRTSLQVFESILGVNAHVQPKTRTGAVSELLGIHFNGLNNMASGVEKGERNFACGRIVQTLKRMNYTKHEASEIVFNWNSFNRPRKSTNELKKEINTFWHDERYKYDGKDFSSEHLQELNKRFIDDKSTFFTGIGTDTHNYDNELLKPDVFQKTSGLTFAVLSVIKLAESDGIRWEQIANLCKRNKDDKKLRDSMKLLSQLKYIKPIIKHRIKHYVFNEKANYKRGYTAVSKSLHRSYIHGELKEHEYKLMILLESYAYDDKKEIYTGVLTLSLQAGQSDRTIRRNLRQLEHKQFIKRESKSVLIKGEHKMVQVTRFVYR